MTEEELMLSTVLNCRRSDLYISPVKLSKDQAERLEDMRSRRAKGEPLQYIFGYTEFMGFHIDVNESVLIPRPETEILVEKTFELSREIFSKTGRLQILDIGTGSGCIALAMANLCPASRITAIDISAAALELAEKNACLNTVGHNIDFRLCDMRDFWEKSCAEDQKFNIIIANPPYIPSRQIGELPDDVQAEPHCALDGGIDGLDFYRNIFANAGRCLISQGILAMEIGDGQKPEIDKLAMASGWDDSRFFSDYTGTPRVLIFIR